VQLKESRLVVLEISKLLISCWVFPSFVGQGLKMFS